MHELVIFRPTYSAFQAFKQYCELTLMGHYHQRKKGTYICLWVGQEGLKMYNSWLQRRSLIKFWKPLEPRTNYHLNRFHFQKYCQTRNEIIDEFRMRCKIQVQRCKFRDVPECEEWLIEQLIIRSKYNKFKKTCLWKMTISHWIRQGHGHCHDLWSHAVPHGATKWWRLPWSHVIGFHEAPFIGGTCS